MIPSDFESVRARDRDAIEGRMRAIVDLRASHHERIGDAIRYALLGGGKRVRPLLCLWTHDVIAGVSSTPTRAAALDAACAIECVHTYSLVHDDLPCMDDDDLRRGRPSLHRAFDEATAVLTGDALLTLAFEILATLPASSEVALESVRVLSEAAGSGGLIAGQAMDLAASGATPTRADVELVERIHEKKTASLIAAAMEIGALVSTRATQETRERVRQAGVLTGSAFQIVDDLLDVQGEAGTLGKTAQKDLARGKLTYPAAAGVTGAAETARARIIAALAALPEAAGTPLEALIQFVAQRQS